MDQLTTGWVRWIAPGARNGPLSGVHLRETPLPKTVTSLAAIVLMLCCIVPASMADAWAASLERVEFASASVLAGTPGDRIQGYLAKPDGAGPFPAVIGLHGCAGMHDTTKQRLADDLVARGYVVLLVDSYATRGIDHACTSTAFATFLRCRPDACGALVFLARQTFVDPHRVAAVASLKLVSRVVARRGGTVADEVSRAVVRRPCRMTPARRNQATPQKNR